MIKLKDLLRENISNHKLGETILKDVNDEDYVHFTSINNRPSILAGGLKYVKDGIGIHFFKAREAKKWNISQVKSAIGDLAGSSLDISGVAIVSKQVAESSGLKEFRKPFWTEYVSQQQGIKVLDVKKII